MQHACSHAQVSVQRYLRGPDLDVLDRDRVSATSTRVGWVLLHDEGRLGRPVLLLRASRGEGGAGSHENGARYGRGERWQKIGR
jgi:hypothetical protein